MQKENVGLSQSLSVSLSLSLSLFSLSLSLHLSLSLSLSLSLLPLHFSLSPFLSLSPSLSSLYSSLKKSQLQKHRVFGGGSLLISRNRNLSLFCFLLVCPELSVFHYPNIRQILYFFILYQAYESYLISGIVRLMIGYYHETACCRILMCIDCLISLSLCLPVTMWCFICSSICHQLTLWRWFPTSV